MKKIFKLLVYLLVLTASCAKEPEPEPPVTTYPSTDPNCGTYNGRTLYKGPQGGCYYINSNGNKTYVDRSYCSC